LARDIPALAIPRAATPIHALPLWQARWARGRRG
jgi:hypothetical protein